jgi:hypothetical protein
MKKIEAAGRDARSIWNEGTRNAALSITSPDIIGPLLLCNLQPAIEGTLRYARLQSHSSVLQTADQEGCYR